MKTLAVFLLFASTLMTGCIVADPAYHGENRGYHERDNMRGDRDGDGVPNRQDRRPDDARRY